MRCETCIYWMKWKDSVTNLGTCKKVVNYWDVQDWDAETFEDKPTTLNAKFFVQDAEDFAAYVYTRNDFGCVEYKEKANEHV